ncbi:Xaa-Pro dipeptidyl-peptidase [Gossypium arboreum]|uniref:Xaa-Pro dipeptidyl-peptidase n=1 Tax=Gossypium arboreum TaxID=29729 RepID=A0A0B0N2C5_GOSAR|nr:Xaa-Pro dipeptidyl-peptidase [Gossypium arboreum]
MYGTWTGIETRASVRLVWDMHQHRDIQATCKTCLGHGIDFDVLATCCQSNLWIITVCQRSQSHYP